MGEKMGTNLKQLIGARLVEIIEKGGDEIELRFKKNNKIYRVDIWADLENDVFDEDQIPILNWWVEEDVRG